MSNQNKNEDEKAIIALGKMFKIFALIATILTIALLIYIAMYAEPKVSWELSAVRFQLSELVPSP